MTLSDPCLPVAAPRLADPCSPAPGLRLGDHSLPGPARRPWSCARLLRAALAIALVALSGCVAFERAPVEELSCDPDLPGTWHLKADGVAKTVHIDARCHTEDWPNMGEQTMALDLTGFVLDRDRYIVVPPSVAQRAIGAPGDALIKGTPAGSVFLILYRIDEGRARAWLPDSQRALDAMAAGTLTGRKLDEKFPLIEGSAQDLRTTLQQHSAVLYDTQKEAIVLQRAAPASKDSR
ncbi:hypothetical protein [Lysobacter capsici]|uniref:hypothetical protein n=1 Tax=Lysobacter capsici TaxID=435897 RepID=UPI001C007193|nr:hypothetical protein [Lysobacter capsici]QWF15149.1 hypothetical protein KME82_15205 [Lysobacter capsici]